MDLDQAASPKEKSSSIAKKFEGITKFINFGLIILVIGLLGVYISKNFPTNSSSPTNTSTAKIAEITSAPISSTKLMLDITGAVKSPGVYEMSDGDRIVDLIAKAGGFTEKVDLEYVEKNINKAEKLIDGQKIYIPKIGDNITTTPTKSSNSSSSTTSSPAKSSGPVSINSGSRQDLIDLPEIGEVTADKIIAARPYANIDELVKKGVLKQSSLDKIRTQLKL